MCIQILVKKVAWRRSPNEANDILPIHHNLNPFVVQSVAADVPLRHIVFGTLPYVFTMAGVLVLMALFPKLTHLLHAAAR